MSTEKTADPLSMEEDAAPQSTEQTTDPLSVEETADPLSLTSLLLPMEDTAAPQSTEQTADPLSLAAILSPIEDTADPLSLTGILLSTEDTVAPQSTAQTAQPLFWLLQLEALLCERFRELGHQFAQVREEIVTHVANVIADSAEQDSWDARKFTWLMLREWQDNALTDKVFPEEPPPQDLYRIDVSRIESLRYLPRDSCLRPWDHACLCAAELCNTIRLAVNTNVVLFQDVLEAKRIRRPVGDPPRDAAVVGQSRAEEPLVDGDFLCWSDYLDRLESELLRARQAITAVKKQNLEMASRLSETQAELSQARRSLGL
ncbi:hypothetical protein X797_011093 [Metarhizium robertsii]|uniref:Uncharacterized protein n=2 Tax=Metarhizium robertsii TaxID=568076 RepID=E9F762_METRA|nr:uncharacterized protein MAA_08099 [Metarhizium robertsii ARSEF 23]EFY96392.1 hypothetical protein MAA_08099 [Metarhizium robertsii ARSEF 23]EXU95849.1 hypothetical protein X797_011093 [Metarhizium robertsii]